MTTLTLKFQPEAPLEAATITPENFLGKPAAAIARLPVMHGNEPAFLGDFFHVEGDGSGEVVLVGDLSRIKSVGAEMKEGTVIIQGDAGMHLGAGMRGGQIRVCGNAGDWAGAEMAGGRINIQGNAGHGLGGAYRGSRRGMNRGLIIVEGNAGNEVGALMRRGLIAVAGNAGDFTGAFMIAGSIIVFGALGIRAGAGLLRGSIVSFQPAELLPTYRYDCSYRPDFLNLIFQQLQREGLSMPDGCMNGIYKRYSGDFNRSGKGEILVYDQRQ
jgi:formylmethanofuran dehydrogenase subunit C